MEQEKIGYAIRLSANAVLYREIAHLLVRPTDGPSGMPIVSYHDFTYQAQSWDLPRRVISKVEWHQGELFPRVGFIVTNLSYPQQAQSASTSRTERLVVRLTVPLTGLSKTTAQPEAGYNTSAGKCPHEQLQEDNT